MISTLTLENSSAIDLDSGTCELDGSSEMKRPVPSHLSIIGEKKKLKITRQRQVEDQKISLLEDSSEKLASNNTSLEINKTPHAKISETPNSPEQPPKKTFRPKIMPDKYDGSTDWNEYVAHFDTCREINAWSQEEAALYMAARFRGQALRLLEEQRNMK